jgi:hypothetical protein
MIDAEKAKKGERDYLMWWDSSFVEDARYLDLLWLDRFIVAQGARFRDWPRMDVEGVDDANILSASEKVAPPKNRSNRRGGVPSCGGHSWDEKRRARYGQTLRN